MYGRAEAWIAGGLLCLLGLVSWLSASSLRSAPLLLRPSPPVAIARSQAVEFTARDFELPGSQPGALENDLAGPEDCASCHAGLHELVDQPEGLAPHEAWSGSMMSQAGRDPIFLAALDVANADLPGSGEFCLRCHMPGGWLAGRSKVVDGSAMTAVDREGVHCAVCHRMVDPRHGQPGPERDDALRSAITRTVTRIGSGAFLLDPANHIRGPRDLSIDWDAGFEPHLGAEATLTSPFHRDAALCGSCHDIDNPLLSWDEAQGAYLPNAADQPPPPGDRLFPIERTYTEWRLSAFNRGSAADAAGPGASCQDCHMGDQSGAGGQYFGELRSRDDLAQHDLTGASTWAPLAVLADPANQAYFEARPAQARALLAGIPRARASLARAARLVAVREGKDLKVTVVNQTGHKLPTGYVEGRRMWLDIRAYDRVGRRILSSGVHEPESDALTTDPGLPLFSWEAVHGMDPVWAARLGKPAGPDFHFVLNNRILRDDRIPPRGYRFESFAAEGAAPHRDGQPDPLRYADGQFWDTMRIPLPDEAVSGTVRLMHQSATREYIDFLAEANAAGPGNRGERLKSIWEATGRAAPETMAEQHFGGWTLWLPRLEGP